MLQKCLKWILFDFFCLLGKPTSSNVCPNQFFVARANRLTWISPWNLMGWPLHIVFEFDCVSLQGKDLHLEEQTRVSLFGHPSWRAFSNTRELTFWLLNNEDHGSNDIEYLDLKLVKTSRKETLGLSCCTPMNFVLGVSLFITSLTSFACYYKKNIHGPTGVAVLPVMPAGLTARETCCV